MTIVENFFGLEMFQNIKIWSHKKFRSTRSSLGHRICLLTAEYALFEFCIFRSYGAILKIVEIFLDLKCSKIQKYGLISNTGPSGQDLGIKIACLLLNMHYLNFASSGEMEQF